MARVKIFRGPEAFAGTLQEQVNAWAKKENVSIVNVSSSVEKSPMGLCSVNFITLTVTYEPSRSGITSSGQSSSSGTPWGNCSVCGEAYPHTFKQCKCGAILPWAKSAVRQIPKQVRNKRCPYCAEEIQLEARKCRYCGEWLPNELKESELDTDGLQSNSETYEVPPETVVFHAQGLKNIHMSAQKSIIELLKNKQYASAAQTLRTQMPNISNSELCAKLAAISQAVGVNANETEIKSQVNPPMGYTVGLMSFLLFIFGIPLAVIGWVLFQAMFR